MVKRPIFLIVIGLGACVLLAIGIVLLMRTSQDQERAKAFFGSPKQYDMKNGQEMRPRW